MFILYCIYGSEIYITITVTGYFIVEVSRSITSLVTNVISLQLVNQLQKWQTDRSHYHYTLYYFPSNMYYFIFLNMYYFPSTFLLCIPMYLSPGFIFPQLSWRALNQVSCISINIQRCKCLLNNTWRDILYHTF